MNHDTAIPQELHVGARAFVKGALGDFWSSVFEDQDLVDADIVSRVLSASQLYIDAMEALSLRDHRDMPVFHREHWHPVAIRLSQRNTGVGLTVGMPDTPCIGPQPEGSVYLEDEVFCVGGNAAYSKVNTYPISSRDGLRLVRVDTCICDSIANPKHILVQGRDFDIDGDVLVIRKEQDPFYTDPDKDPYYVSGYRITEDGDDKIAVLWVCDGAFDENNVSDFIGYPLGFDVASTEAAARMLSALWDVVIYGITPRYMNIALGSVFGVPVCTSDTQVERIDVGDDGFSTVVTSDAVYRIVSDRLSSAVVDGARLSAGDFLTNDLAVYHSLSRDEFIGLVEKHEIESLSLPPGSVLGVTTTVVVEDVDTVMEDGGWFKLNSGDTGDSDFWFAVRSRVSEDELKDVFSRLSYDGTHVNPLRALGYLSLANTVLVRARCGLCADPFSGIAFSALSRLVASYASMVVVQSVGVTDTMGLGAVTDDATWAITVPVSDFSESGLGVSDSVSYTFIPVP